ncbi:MAG: hypothetical protein ACI4RT_04925 [Candidatus Spyradenecus sp.]
MSRWKILGVALLGAALLFANGCIWTRAKVNDAAVCERAKAIVPGQTRAEQLPAVLGVVPSSVIPLKDGRQVLVFAYGDAKTEGVSLIVVTFTKTNSAFSAVYVLVNAQGVVERVQTAPQQELAWETWPFGA